MVKLFVTLVTGIWFLLGCDAKQKTICEDPSSRDCPTASVAPTGATASDIKISRLKPLVAKPGQVVTVTGINLTQDAELKIGDQSVAWTSVAGDTATFVMPVMPHAGVFAINVTPKADRKVASQVVVVVDAEAKFMISNSAGDAYPIFMASPEQICAPTAYRDADGILQVGIKDCNATTLPDCTQDGQSGCVANSSFTAAATAGLASKIISGDTVAGVAGNVTLPPPGKVYTGTQFGVEGTGITGTLTLPSPSNVRSTEAAYGDPASPLTPALQERGFWNLTTSFPGAGYYQGVTNIPASASILSGTILTGISGTATAESHTNCVSDGATDCVTTAAFKAADMANVNPGAVKSGVTIAGIVGQYPNASYKLTGSSGTDLTAATFNAQIKSSTGFQYFDSNGTRHVGVGDTNIQTNNIASGVSIFGTPGTITSPTAWDLRAGSSVVGPSGTVTGLLKTDCRNGVSLTTLDMDEYPRTATFDSSNDTFTSAAHGYASYTPVRIYGAPVPTGFSDTTIYYVLNQSTDTFQLTATNGGAVAVDGTGAGTSIYVVKVGAGTLDIWDTIDDFNVTNTSSLSIPSGYAGWSGDNLCGGLTTAYGDPQVWVDVTATASSIKDKITGLEWQKPVPGTKTWTQALSYCDGLTYNNRSDWRLPTQKELLTAYNHGIVTTANVTNWMTQSDFGYYYWSSTSYPSPISNAWMVYLRTGNNSNTTKTGNHSTICVRP